MTDPTPGPDSNPDGGQGPDDPDRTDPLTVDQILAAAGAGQALDRLPASDSQASRLVALTQFHFQLVKGTDGRPYATALDGPAIAYNLRGRDALRTRLARLYFDTYTQAPSGTALTDALAVLEGLTDRTDPTPVGLRVARAPDGPVVVDFANPDGHAAIIGPGGWRVVERSPVLFRRSALTAPLPEPERGGSLDGLGELINVDEPGFRLLAAWLVAALIPDIPHPILALFGEQGTAKSTAARLLVGLVDPSPAPLRTPPREMRSWAAAAHASWVVALDNVSTIPAWLSDTLCKAVTGDGVVERTLNTDDDINVLAFRRVIALTSIDAGRLAGDLAERLLPVELDPIPVDRRRTDAEITATYDTARPRILGALLDLTAQVLAALPGVQLRRLPRMADFARVLAALDHTQGWDTLTDYTTAAQEAALAVLDYDPVAVAIRELVGRGGGWKGTPGELLDRITSDHPPKDWPRSPRALGGALKRLAPALRAGWGITIDRPPRGQNRTLTLRAGRLDDAPGPSNE
ncbi:MAG: ATP-binding protein [Acidimicrobiales bacterium]